MILKLSIKNYILIEKLDVNFKEGFSSITGETGAGKSIILGALNLISGARVDHQIVGPKNEKCIVEGEFLISESLLDFFNFHDLDFDDHTILRREILVNGKSRAFINDSPVKLDIIKSLSEKLINVHSQNHNHILSNNNMYYELLDWRNKYEKNSLIKKSQIRESHKDDVIKVEKNLSKFFNVKTGDVFFSNSFSRGFHSLVSQFKGEPSFLVLENDYPSISEAIIKNNFNIIYVKNDLYVEENIKIESKSFFIYLVIWKLYQ